MNPKSPWFDEACINSKRELNRLAKSYGKTPQVNISGNCITISAGHIGNSSSRRGLPSFKELKQMKTKDSTLDVFDMFNFCKFFKDLYSKPLNLDPNQLGFCKGAQTADHILTLSTINMR